MIPEPLALACAAYVVGTATPGPATLLIATTSMRRGRRIGLATALGVLSGSLAWGLLAAGGAAAALAVWAPWGRALRVAGGLYLLWLSVRSIRSALATRAPAPAADGRADRARRAFARGLLVHLTNPKAVLSWLATVAVGTSSATTPIDPFVVVAVCWCLGVVVFVGYAVAFASARATAFYVGARRQVDAFAGAVFGSAGLFLLAPREPEAVATVGAVLGSSANVGAASDRENGRRRDRPASGRAR